MKHTFTKYPSNYVGAASETSGAAMRKKKRAAEQRGKEGAELLAEDGEWELWTPHTFEGSVYLANKGGSKAAWDTADEGGGGYIYFYMYTEKGPLYIFINKATGEKYQSHPATKSWFLDARDRDLGRDALEAFICKHPAFAPFFDVQCDEDIEVGVNSLDYATLKERLIENYWSGNGVDEVFWDWSDGSVDAYSFIIGAAGAWHRNDSGNSWEEDVDNAIDLAQKIGYDISGISTDDFVYPDNEYEN